ncbi:MAG: PEGA domain-containing protein [Myxococcaceae bacterium]
MPKLFPTLVLAFALAASPTFAAAGPAGAPKPLVAIVDVEAPPNMMGLAAQVTQEVLRAATAQGYAVITPEEIRGRLGDKAYSELQGCHGRTVCLVSRLMGIRTDRVVVGTLGRDEKSYLVRLWLVDLAKSEVIADVDRSILIASRRLNQDVTAAMPGLLRGEKEARGTLKLTSNAKRVAVTVNGEDKGLTPLTLELKPGKHEIRLEKKAYMPVERLVTIEAGKVTDEVVRLIVIPGQIPEEDMPPPPVVAEARAEPGGKPLSVPAAAWAAGGVAVAAAGAGAWFGLAASRGEKKLTASFDPSAGVYGGTRKDALQAKQNALVANVCFAAAGAALAAGVVVTVLGASEPEAPQAQVAPLATAGGGGLLVGGTF